MWTWKGLGHGSQESRAEGRGSVKCLGDWDITLRAMRKFLWLELGHSSRRSSSGGHLECRGTCRPLSKAVNQKHEDPCYQTSVKNLSETHVMLSALLFLHPGSSSLSSQRTPMFQVVPKRKQHRVERRLKGQ